jgi:hypothetical protein
MIQGLRNTFFLPSFVEERNQLVTRNFQKFRGPAVSALALILGVAAGCGSSGIAGTQGGNGPIQGESTLVTVVASSTANDQLARFSLFLNSLTLTNKAGTSVTVISAPQQVEFMHLNGSAEPLLTVSVPQDVYTSATATVGAASFTCAVLQNSSDTTATYAYGYTTNAQVTTNLPEPLTVEGGTMAVTVNLEVSQSATFPASCYFDGIAPFSITPTFNLAAMTVGAQPTNTNNGRMTGLEGLVASMGGAANSFTVDSADGTNAFEISTSGSVVNSAATVWSVTTNSSTVFQGIANLAGLTAGMPVDFDGELQPDGSVVATRVAVADADTTDLTVNSGPLMEVEAAYPLLYQVNRESEGSEPLVAGWPMYNYESTTFATWGGLTNAPSLPFPASFSGENMVAGQMVSITSHATAVQPWPTVVPAATVTLMPQTVNGTVSAVGTQGSFTTYTVTLASYDVFPQFAVQGGQTTLLTNPQQIVVYTDQNTQVLSAGAVSAGNVARFTGVVFNDNGTLRMDCTQVMDGVAVGTLDSP